MSVSRGKRGNRSIREKLKAGTGNSLTHAVIKATDSSGMAPKYKHIEALLSFTFTSNIPNNEVANALIERTQEKTWIPVLKAMTCIHRLIRDGSKDFFLYLSQLPVVFNLSSFSDMSSAEGPVLSSYIKSYNGYLNQKVKLFDKMQFDYCHASAADEVAKLATDEPARLFKGLNKILMQMDWILNMVGDDSIVSTLGNMVVRESGGYLFKDIMKLWLCANTASVNLLERFFKLNEEQAKEGLRLMETFFNHCKRVDKFVQVCTVVGCSEGKEIPPTGENLVRVLPALRAHVKKGTLTERYTERTVKSNNSNSNNNSNNNSSRSQDPLLSQANSKGAAPTPTKKKKKPTQSSADPFDPRSTPTTNDPFATDPFANPNQNEPVDLAANPQNPFL